MRIMGIDPGTRIVGYGVIDHEGSSLIPQAGGIIRCARDADMCKRLAQIQNDITVVLKRCKPAVVAVEQVFYGKNISTLIKIGEARGAILAACGKAEVKVFGHSPAAVKKAVTGNGRATKAQVREMHGTLLGSDLSCETEDVSDALAVAICQAHRARFQLLQSRA